MSADNYLFIEPKTNKIYSCVASCIGKSLNKQKLSLIGRGKTLDEAMKIAEEYQKKTEDEGNYIEYGICRSLWCK